VNPWGCSDDPHPHQRPADSRRLVVTLAVQAAPRSGRPRSRLYAIAQRIAARFEPTVARAFLSAVQQLQSQINQGELEDAVASDNLDQILSALSNAGDLRVILEGRASLTNAIQQTATATGRAGAQILEGATGLSVRFNALDPNVIFYARTQAAQLIRAVTEDQREAVRIVLGISEELGLTVRQRAMAIKEIVGLAPNHASAPLTMAEELRQGRFDYSRRMFKRDKNAIRARLAAGTVDEAFVTKMQGRYSDSLHTLRATTIARTETIAASNSGLRTAWRQAQRGGILPTTTKRVVLVTPDERLRPLHLLAGQMNIQGVDIDRPFNTPWGLLDGPPWSADPYNCPWGLLDGPPWSADPYNCRCSESLIFPSGRVL
jgi:hypothetical protein